jgi:hypothetical protein
MLRATQTKKIAAAPIPKQTIRRIAALAEWLPICKESTERQ